MKKLLKIMVACIAMLLYLNVSLAESLSTDLNTNAQALNGNYLNITASNKDVYISGFDLNMLVNGTVSVYYKAGSYVGSEINNAAWTFLASRTIVAGNSLAAINIGGVTIPAGQTYGFYLYSTGDLRYNSEGSRENFTNQDIKIFANKASGTLFGGVLTRVFSGSVHYSVKELTTTFVNNNSLNGNYVNISAKDKDIHISGFDVNFDGNGLVSVYYKNSSYKGSETTAANWLFLGSRILNGVAGIPTELSVGGIVIPAGETYGFAFYTSVPNGIKYTDSIFVTIPDLGEIPINEHYHNDDLSIFSDTGVGATLFVSKFNDRVWNGRVHYFLPEKLGTINAANLSAEGHFFNVTARDRNVHISSFDVNFDDTDEEVKVWYREGVYQGNVGSSSGWTLLGKANITGVAGTLTELPVGGITIPAGETYGFLIHAPDCSSCMLLSNTGSAGNFSNSDLSIYTGTSKYGSSPFSGSVYSPRVWNGAIHYSVKEGVSCYVSRAANGKAFTFCL